MRPIFTNIVQLFYDILNHSKILLTLPVCHAMLFMKLYTKTDIDMRRVNCIHVRKRQEPGKNWVGCTYGSAAQIGFQRSGGASTS